MPSHNRKVRPHIAEPGDTQLRHDAQARTASATPGSAGNGASALDQAPQRTAFEDWVAYWQPITRQWPPLDAEGIAAVAAVVARIERRRADTTDGGDDGDGENPGAR
ncbi:hypothetical protein [Nocardia sp. NPDC058114]|uniref:hypothetical protein n=1 Tax=Nocardia sp. NPDC058114 TaxID=3346346 RepID=UPI0036DB1D69